MKAIILAAGEGNRLRPITESVPKCLVPLRGKPIIEYQLEVFRALGITDIAVVTGYRREALKKYHLKEYFNEKYDVTNMVYSLFCAEEFLCGEDVIVSYGDIIYDRKIVDALMQSNSNISVVVDEGWEALWGFRMENPWDDAETLKLDSNGNIIELGKKITSKEDVQGQYIGLFKIKAEFLDVWRSYYHGLNKDVLYDSKDFYNMYMTSFLDLITKNIEKIKSVKIMHNWLEVDTIQDLQLYESPTIKEELFNFGSNTLPN